ncbi:hypothetical protein DL96DRAFT_1454733 [Flagelloscypha sp. PMI_526]|nr:hypothetical protein DL96DRAFT_1454733 [Flagelloscypha sp. PMI_526]
MEGKDGLTIAIIGAGAAGLFAALTLELLKKQGLNVSYTILESQAADSDHPYGGRLWTHKFSSSPNDYYDRGAMRYPDMPFMQPVQDLFAFLKINKPPTMIPYIMSDKLKNNINFFNGIRLSTAELEGRYNDKEFDPFRTGLPTDPEGKDHTVLYADPSTMVNNVIGDYKAQLIANWEVGWQNLMTVDKFSTRAYLSSRNELPDEIITYLETQQTATGLWNQALSETVMDSLDFDYPGVVPWHCFQGGSHVIAEAMYNQLPSGSVVNGKRVTAIALGKPKEDGTMGVDITCAGEADPTTYSHVITTLPFGALQTVDTTDAGFSYNLQTAIRTLSYDASTKVAIKFKQRWWETRSNQIGGVSNTDSPTRVVVYPSYGIHGNDATMIVSYTWAQDALRFGSQDAKILQNVILRDLADMHDIKDAEGKRDYSYLPDLVMDCDAWSWYNDENSAGAFALFGPGQFSNLYTEVTKPVNGIIHFAGEATSVHHAWVLGAISSAARAIIEIVCFLLLLSSDPFPY